MALDTDTPFRGSDAGAGSMLAPECAQDHTQADRRGRDIDRLDALRRAGWWVIVVTAPQLARPNRVPDRVREALLDRGWVPGENPWQAVWTENRAANARRASSLASV